MSAPTRTDQTDTERMGELGEAQHSFGFEAIGTVWRIDIWQDMSDEALSRLAEDVVARIDGFDRTYSRFRDDSLVADAARRSGSYRLPDDAGPLIGLYRQLYNLSHGAVTPLIGQSLSDAGYDAAYSLQPATPQTPPAWDDVLDWQQPVLTLKRPALLDFGAAGKGYLVDIVSRIIDDAGIATYCVDAGGDLYVRSPGPSLTVGLEHPDDPESVIGVARLRDRSLCGSAGNRRAWCGYHHILDPRSLQSPRHIAALWTVADSGLLADGLATALFFVPPQRLTADFRFEYAIMHADGRLEHSPAFPAEFFTGPQ